MIGRRVSKRIVIAICLSAAAVTFLLSGWLIAALVCFAAAQAAAVSWQLGIKP